MQALIATTNQSLLAEVRAACAKATMSLTAVASVYEAAQILKSDQRTDILLLDLSMGHALDFIRDMKSHARFSDVPVVVLIDDPDPERIKPALEAGADRWLTTAFVRTRLLSVIKSFADTTTSST